MVLLIYCAMSIEDDLFEINKYIDGLSYTILK